MIIKDIQVNGFGNLENKSYSFKNGINIVVGDNESGKSTLIEFIKGILYGVSKNKDGKKFSDFERFKPWKNIEFSGKMSYLKDDKEYVVFREFNKNNTKVYDVQGRELKDIFNKDRARGAEVGFGHLGMDEDTFVSSGMVKQSGIRVLEGSQKGIVQKITNMIQSGDESVSYEKTRGKLEKMLVDEVGTDRTLNKPKNVIKREILENEELKSTLIYKREKEEELNRQLAEIFQKKINVENEKQEVLRVIEIREKYEKQLVEKREAFEVSLKMFEKQKKENEKIKRRRFKEDVFIIFLVSAILSVVFVFLRQYLMALGGVILGVLGFFAYRRFEAGRAADESVPNFDLVIEDLKKKEKMEIKKLEDDGIRKSLLERKLADLRLLQSGLETNKNDLILEEHKINIELNSLKGRINKLNEVEDNLVCLYAQKESLERLENTIRLAIRVLDDSYNELKSEVFPKLEDDIRVNIEKTTNGKYRSVKYNDEQGLVVENVNGEIVTVDKLSLGTVDQMYLGFRLAVASKFPKVPLIFDESFVFCDDGRLINILKTLNLISDNNQVIILTCSDRECDLLNKLNIKFNKISM